jgi:glycine/D-amino acid oxidase-like deaminating enzyme
MLGCLGHAPADWASALPPPGYLAQMKFVVAGGGVAGLAASLAVARAGHEVVVLERDPVHAAGGWRTDRFGSDLLFAPDVAARLAP